MPVKNIVSGQKIDPHKLHRARELRVTMTPAEKMLGQALRGNKLGARFRRQQIIAGYIVNFCCHEATLVIEVDGEIHRKAEEYDKQRDEVLQSMGLRILRVPNHVILECLPEVLKQVEALVGEPAPGVGKTPRKIR
jgi:very-short-patch-repair endonuclease